MNTSDYGNDKTSKVLFSFLVTIFNAESLLNRCLSSILSQTYKNWEAVLVDDGSTDYSGDIADAFAKKDARFRVIHKKNSGTSGATNAALELIVGDYVVNLDDDDYVESNMLEIAASVINEIGPDLIQFPALFHYPDGSITKCAFPCERVVARNHGEMERCVNAMQGGFLRSHSQKVIRRAAIGDLRFSGTARGADTSFMRKVLFGCESAVMDPSPVFHVSVRHDSESRKIASPNLYKEWCRCIVDDLDYCIAKNTVLDRRCPFWEFSDAFDSLKLFISQAIVLGSFDRIFLSLALKEMGLRRSYFIPPNFKTRLSFLLWSRFPRAMGRRLAKKVGVVRIF